MRHITLNCPVDVMPNGQDGNGDDLKQIAFPDPDTGTVIYYPMTQELATTIAKKLRMSNAALVEQKEREIARQRIAMPGDGGSIPPEALAQMLQRNGGGN